MKWKVIVVGKPALVFARLGVEEYLKRLKRYARVDFLSLKDGKRDDVAKRMLEASRGARRIVLDERGECPTTEELRHLVDSWEGEAVKEVALLIGPADGHLEKVREAADYSWALGRATLQHELALVVTLEQLYRVYTVKRGEPYHR
jgi:23S rRNA (pseudouridine1915-N3)-methyltransferase